MIFVLCETKNGSSIASLQKAITEPLFLRVHFIMVKSNIHIFCSSTTSILTSSLAFLITCLCTTSLQKVNDCKITVESHQFTCSQNAFPYYHEASQSNRCRWHCDIFHIHVFHHWGKGIKLNPCLLIAFKSGYVTTSAGHGDNNSMAFD